MQFCHLSHRVSYTYYEYFNCRVPIFDQEIYFFSSNCYSLRNFHKFEVFFNIIFLFYLLLIINKMCWLFFKLKTLSWDCERISNKQRVDWSTDFCFFCYLFSHQWCLCIRRLYVRRLCCVLILKSVLYLFSPECPTSRYSVVHHTRT